MQENKRKTESMIFCGKVAARFFGICCRIDRRRLSGRVNFTTARKHIPRLERVLLRLCSGELDDYDAENLRNRITDPERDGERLFTFLEVNGMPPTNNHAEQSLRLPVIFRKISFGSQSQTGADALAKNLSLLATAKRQRKDPPYGSFMNSFCMEVKPRFRYYITQIAIRRFTSKSGLRNQLNGY